MTFIGELLIKLETAKGEQYRMIMDMIRTMDQLDSAIANCKTVEA